MYRFFFFLLFICTVFLGVPKSYAGSPVLIEIFSSIQCRDDALSQEAYRSIAEMYPEAILVNCNINIGAEATKAGQFSICEQQKIKYVKSLKLEIVQNPQVILNGKHNVDPSNIGVAIRFGAADGDVTGLDVALSDEGEIEISSNQKINGTMALYVYGPSEIGTVLLAEDGTNLPSDDSGNLALPPNATIVPYEKRLMVKSFQPVLHYLDLGFWNSDSQNKSYDLKTLIGDDFNRINELGFVAVLHKDGIYGPVLAVAERKPNKPQSYEGLPLSLPFTPAPVDQL